MLFLAHLWIRKLSNIFNDFFRLSNLQIFMSAHFFYFCTATSVFSHISMAYSEKLYYSWHGVPDSYEYWNSGMGVNAAE